MGFRSGLAALACALSFVGISAQAATTPEIARGLTWLQAQVQPDGTLFGEDGVAATPRQARLEVALTLRALAGTAPAALTDPLAADSSGPAELQARTVLALASPTAQAALMDALQALQTTDGGVAPWAEFRPTVLDSAWAAKALAGRIASLDQVTAWLAAAQSADGSWSVAPYSPLYSTAIALRAMRDSVSRSAAVATAANGAVAYLRSKQLADGSWGEPTWLSALVYEALHDFVADPTFHQAVHDWLTVKQAGDGSWAQDPFTTAIALRALALTGTVPLNPSAAILTIQVTDAVTGTPLPGVALSLSGAAIAAGTSDSSGVAKVTGLPPGSYTGTLSVPGYTAVSFTTTLVADQSKDLGRIQLTRSTKSSTAIVAGTVLDRSSGLPLPGASVTISAGLQATTDSQGKYVIANVPAGSYTLTASKAGYENGAASLVAVAGQEYAYSPSLSPLPTDPASLTLQVLDATTAAPLVGASLSLTGPASPSGVSNGAGTIALVNLPPGSYTGTLRLTSYADVLVSVVLSAKQTLDLGPVRMQKGKGDTHPDWASLSGTIIDGTTKAPLSAVTVSILPSSLQAVTDATGQFSIPKVPPGTYKIAANKAGYTGVSGALSVLGGNDYVFSPSLNALPPDTDAQTCKLSGTLRRASDGRVVAGANVVLGGANSVSIESDASGNYLLTKLKSGVTSISVSASGYDSVNGNLALACSTGAALTYSPLLYASGVSTPDSNTSSVSFTLVNASTGAAIPSAAVTATPLGQAARHLVTDSSGRFTVDRLRELSVQVDINLGGFDPLSLSYQVEPLQSRDLGQLRLRPSGANLLLPDVSLTSVKRATALTDPQSLVLTGAVDAVIRNGGATAVSSAVKVTAFLDVNKDGKFDRSIDTVLGEIMLTTPLVVGQSATVSIPVSGVLPFRDGPIHVMVDSDQQLPESNETNNLRSTADAAQLVPAIGSFKPVLKWHWDGSKSPFPDYNQVMMSPVVGRFVDTNGDGKIDSADVPVVVFVSFKPIGKAYDGGGVIRVVSGQTGAELLTINDTVNPVGGISGLALADLDNDGKPELIAMTLDYRVVAYRNDGSTLWVSEQTSPTQPNAPWGGPTIGDIDSDGSPEIVYGRTVLDAKGRLKWRGTGSYAGSTITDHLATSIPVVADLFGTGQQNVILGASVYSSSGELQWQARDGYAAVADFDGRSEPSIAVVNAGTLSLYTRTGQLRWSVPLPGGGRGGPPTIADVDGDGIPEIGVAASGAYTVFRTDGSVLWSHVSQDFSSQMTGSTVFDFNGDGSSEVLYTDEIRIRAYKGATGEVLWEIPNSSGTAVEYPLAVDVDGDGHADMVTVTNDYYTPANATVLLHGVRVYQDQTNSWVGTRQVWNQHAYSITNVNDDLSIPARPQPSWLAHNSFRSNKRLDVSPTAEADATASYLRLVDKGGSQPSTLTLRVGNGGSLAMPAGVKVAAYSGAPAAHKLLGTVSASKVLGTGDFEDVSISVSGSLAANPLVTLVVDDDGNGATSIADFDRTNNSVAADLSHLSVPATFSLSLETDAPTYQAGQSALFKATITNGGSFAKTGQVRYLVQTVDGQPVTALPVGAVFSFALGAPSLDQVSWNVGRTYTGAYRVSADLLDSASDLVLASASTSFVIQASDAPGVPTLTAALQLDKGSYSPGDTVRLIDRVSNLAANQAWQNLSLRTVVLNPDGSTRWSAVATFDELAANGLREQSYGVALSNAPAGSYQVRLTVLDAAGAVQAQAAKTFTVSSTAATGVGISGHLSVAPKPVFQGGSVSVAFDVLNQGNAALAGLPLTINIVNPGTAQLLASLPVTVQNLATQASFAGSVGWTANVVPGTQVVAVLTAQVGDRSLTLAQDNLTVATPPVTANVAPQREARVLALVSCPPGSDGGATTQPVSGGEANCAVRRGTALAQALTNLGLVNKVVTTRAEFETELRCGIYNTYWISGGSNKLSDDVAKEVIEVIRRGDSLIVEGTQDGRNQLLYPVAGVQLNGSLGQVDPSVTFSGSAEFPAGSLATLGRPSRFTPVGAQLQASFASDAAALTTASFGQGRSTLVAFELARMLEQNDTARQTLLDRVLQVARTSPEVVANGAPVALAIQVSNAAAQAATAQVQATVPAELQLLPGQATSWNLNLAAGQSQTLVLRVKPLQPGDWTVDVTATSGGQVYTAHYSVQAQAPEALADHAVALAQALSVNGDADTAAKSQAVQALTQAQTLGAAQRHDEALGLWLQASSALQTIHSADTHAASLATAQAVQGTERALCPQLACLSGTIQIRQGSTVPNPLPINANANVQRQVANSCPAPLPSWQIGVQLRNRRTAQTLLQLDDELSLGAGQGNTAQGNFLASAGDGLAGDTLEALLVGQRLGWQHHLGRASVPLAGTLMCDVDGDGAINTLDIQLIMQSIGKTVAAGDPRDPDGDKIIKINDSRACTARCTKPNCAQ